MTQAYDGNGNRISKIGEQKLAGGERDTLQVTYQYNVRGQILEENRDGDACRYTYDAAGNRTRKESMEGTIGYRYNGKNQLVNEEGNLGRKTFIYDRQGSIIREESESGTRQFLYNTKNQQTEVRLEDGRAQVNRYDAESLRCEMKENEKLIRFVYHRGELLYERSGESQTSYYLGAGIEAGQSGEEVHYYHQDEQLSTALITDSSGIIQNHYQYDAFGQELGKAEKMPNRIRYTGQQYDVQTEQYYLRARYYNPILGRFMQEDVYQGDGLNLYAYCDSNPVMYYDPSGYAAVPGGGCPPGSQFGGDAGEGGSGAEYGIKGENIKVSSAEDVNNWWKTEMKYDNPPYKPGTTVTEFKLTQDTTFVRVYDGEKSGQFGGWVMRAEDIKGLTPSQIQDKFALPAMPKYVTDVNLPADTTIRGGIVNPRPLQ